MRLRCVPTPEQRAALEAQLLRLQQPGAALELPCERTDLVRVTTTVASVHTDRFVVRARLSFRSGEERSYALKAYADDFAGRAWTHARALAERYRTDAGELCLPIACIASERLLVFPRSEEHTSELQSRLHLVCRLLLEKKKKNHSTYNNFIHQSELFESRSVYSIAARACTFSRAL